MSRSQFTTIVWLLSVFGLPLLVYVGITVANTSGLPVDTGCQVYHLETALFLSLLAGVPFATIVTVLSAFTLLKHPLTFSAWVSVVIMLLLGLALFIVLQAPGCV